MFAFREGAVGDALQKLGVIIKVADMPPVDLVGMGVEVRVAQRLKPSKHRVDRSFLCDEGVLGSGALAHRNAS